MQTLEQEHILKRVKHIIVALNQSGLAIFHHSFSHQPIDPDLFSALLIAHSIERRMRTSSREPEMEVLEISGLICTICHSEILSGIVISYEPVQNDIMHRLMNFVTSFEREYEFILHNWQGHRSFFDQDWAVSQLREHLLGRNNLYRLHDVPLERITNAAQIRVYLLLKRLTVDGKFDFDSMVDYLIEQLEIEKSGALTILTELEIQGVIINK